MDLSSAEVGYFIQQVALSAKSFGVADADLTVVGDALGSLFDYKCAAPVEVIPGQGAQLQAICVGADCPLAMNATCDAYNSTLVMPSTAVSSLVPSTTAKVTGTATSMMSASMTMTGSSSASASPTKNAAAAANGYSGMGVAAVAGGFAALLL